MSNASAAAPPRSSRRSRFAAVVAAVVLAASAPKLYAQAMRVAVVDMQRALVETEQGRRAKNQLKTLFQRHQEELDGRQRALTRLRDELERQRTTLSQDEMRRRMEDYQKQFVDLQQNYMDYQQELANREAELTKQILVNLQTVVRTIGSENSYTAIFDQVGVVWSPQHLDLTDIVVQRYNQRFPGGAAAPPGPAPRGDAGTAVTPAPTPRATGDAGVAAPVSTGDAGARRPAVNPHPRGEPGAPPGR